MASKATLDNSGKRLLSNEKRLSCVLEVLLHLQGKNVKYCHKSQIARLHNILIFICQNYKMASTVTMSSLKTH